MKQSIETLPNTGAPAESRIQHLKKFTCLLCVFATCMTFYYRFYINNGFSTLGGDRFDAVLSAAILEHWGNWIKGLADWSNVGYYFPYTRTIAQTDGYFLVGLAYMPFRLCGIDPFISQELAMIVIKATGFAGAYYLCRRMFLLSFGWSLVAAVLFTLSNGATVHNSRIQLASVAFAPLQAIFIWKMCLSFWNGSTRRFMIFTMLSMSLYGAWCITCFYMAWFFAFFSLTFVVALLFTLKKKDFIALKNKVLEKKYHVSFAIVAFAAALAPFIYAYLPKSLEVGTRSFDTVFERTVPLENILQVGTENLVFGRLYNQVLKFINPEYVPNGEYYNTGFNILIFSFFLFACYRFILKAKNQKDGWVDRILKASAVATIITLLCTLRIGNFCLWFFVYHFIPGARALNVVSAYLILLAFPIIVLAAKFIDSLPGPKVLKGALAFMLILGELNDPYVALDRRVELQKIALTTPPPADCKVFYVSGWNAPETDWVFSHYAHNVTAIMLSQLIHLPTINGIASFSPADWNFAFPNKADYDERVMAYSRRHRIESIYKLDLNTKEWLGPIPIPPVSTERRKVVFSDKSWLLNTDIQIFTSKSMGLSGTEHWGTWSDGGKLQFAFTKELPESFRLYLRAHAFGPNIGKEFIIKIGSSERRFSLGSEDSDVAIDFMNPEKSNLMTIIVPQPTSPKSLDKKNNDKRKLGIGLVSLTIVPN